MMNLMFRMKLSSLTNFINIKFLKCKLSNLLKHFDKYLIFNGGLNNFLKVLDLKMSTKYYKKNLS